MAGDPDRSYVPLPPRGRPLPSGAAAQAVLRPARTPGRTVEGEGRGERFPALDAVRGLAALSVVAFHAYKDLAGRPGWDTPLGTFAYSLQWAVPVFFVLSGFLLYRPFAAAIARGAARPDARAFLWRRAARIFPAYWLALVVFGTLAQPDRLWTPDGVVRYGLLLQVFDADTVYHVLGTAWSLSIEVGFYLALPVLAWLIARILGAQRGLGRHLAILVGLVAIATALRYLVIARVQAAAGEDPGLAGFTLAGSFGPFAAGMALAAVTVSRRELHAAMRGTPRRVRWVVARLFRRDGPWLAVALLAYSLGLLVEGRYIVPWQPGVFATIAAAALLAPLVMRPATSRAAAFLGGSRALVSLGAISYGLYLWHWPIQELARTHGYAVEGSIFGWAFGFATMATLGIIAATASHRFLEAPINARVRSLTRTPRPSGAGEVGGLESGAVSASPRSIGAPSVPSSARRRKTARPVARAES